jgi:hypothetical protein
MIQYCTEYREEEKAIWRLFPEDERTSPPARRMNPSIKCSSLKEDWLA